MLRFKYVYLAILILATLLIYLPGLNGPFLLDDYSSRINTYPYGLDWQEILSASFAQHSGALGRPLANLSFILNTIIDRSAWGYKLVNLILHLISGILLFQLVQKLSRVSLDISGKQARLMAMVVTAFWLLHPLQVSTVLYAVQRMSILSALFVTGALLIYTRFRTRSQAINAAKLAGYIGSYTLLWILGLASKESAALLPLFVLILELCIFRFNVRPQHETRRNLHLFLTLLVYLPLLAGAIYTTTHFTELTAGYFVRDFTISERLYTEIHAIIFYLKVIIIPDLASMGIYHDDFQIQSGLTPLTITFLAVITLSIITALIFRNRFPLASLGILWFFTAHLLESTFLPLELVFEHRNYLALAGIGMLLSELLLYLLQRSTTTNKHRLIWGCFILFFLFLSLLTYLRVDTWSSREKLFAYQERQHPNSPRVLMELINIDVPRHHFDLAYSRINKIEELSPQHTSHGIMRLIINCHENRYSKENLNRAVQLHHGHPKWFRSTSELLNLGQLSLAGRCKTYSNGEITQLVLDIVDNRTGRSSSLLHFMVGQLYAKSGNHMAAREQYALSFTRDNSQLQPLIAKAYLELNTGQLDAAESTIHLLRKSERDTIVYYDHLISELEQHLTHAKTRSQ
jgi:protein O-mannosyl-transferase